MDKLVRANTITIPNKFTGHKRGNNYNVKDERSARRSKRVKEGNAMSGEGSVMQLLDFRAVSWIWDRSTTDQIEKKDDIDKDYISRLPDDILLNILSRLTMKGAARTSLVSSRWRYLWTFLTGIFNFDKSRTLEAMLFRLVEKSLPDEMDRFVKNVNQALKSHQGPSIDELSICFQVDNVAYGRDIDSWINFAKEKRVKRLHLDLTMAYGYLDHHAQYIFPSQLLGSSSFMSLKALRLRCVGVTGEVIEYFLSNCPLLEVLCVANSSCLRNLKVCGPSLKLKYLDISCHKMENVEISALNLVSFKYHGEQISSPFKNVPRLSEVSFGGSYCKYLIEHDLHGLSSYLSQLEMLTLDLTFKVYGSFGVDGNFPNFPRLNNLKRLELIVKATDDNDLLYYFSLIDASPSLRRLSLKLHWIHEHFVSMEPLKTTYRRHQCLRVVEIAGFKGVLYDLKLATYLLEYAVLLEKIIIDPRTEFFVKRKLDCYENKEELEAARIRAQKLESTLPPRAKLVIR